MAILKPARQGVLDGACGFYATTHAISILVPDLSREYIFEAVIRSAMQDGDPMNFIKGTRRGTIKNILSRTISLLNQQFSGSLQGSFKFSIPYWQTAPLSRKDFFSTFNGLNYKSGKSAILGYSNKPTNDPGAHYHHWTVAREFYGDVFVTHDSSGEKKLISSSEMRVNDYHHSYHSGQPYFMESDDVFIVEFS